MSALHFIDNANTVPRMIYLSLSAKNKYTFKSFYGTILPTVYPKGGYHENHSQSRHSIQQRHPDFKFRTWQNPHLPRGLRRSQKNPNGYVGGVDRSFHRGDLPLVRLQDPQVLLRYSTFGPRKQHRSLVAWQNWPPKPSQADQRIGKTGYSVTPDYRPEHVRHDPHPEPGGLSRKIQACRSDPQRLRNQQKKIAAHDLKDRSRALLTAENIEILNGNLKPKRVEVTRQSIQADLEGLLKRGITTTHAGGFFFIPFLQAFDLYNGLAELSAPKTAGIPNEKVALQLIWEPLFGYTRGIRAVDPISQADFGALSGLPFICSAATEYRFLTETTIERSELFQKRLGKRLVDLGEISGQVLNLDGHSIKLFSRKEMKVSFLTKEKAYGKAIRTFYTQDQVSKKPIFAKVAYSGTTVAQVTPQLVEANKEILNSPFLCVSDKEWFIGDLLDQLDKIHGIEVLLPLKRTVKRNSQLEAIPFEKFRHRYQGQPVATLVTDLTGFNGKMKLFVKQNPDRTFFALITNKKYLRAERALDIYRRRWRIENFFNENSFLGLDCLPSLELNALQTALSLKLVSYHLVDNFRGCLPDPLSSMKPESIYRHFIQGVQGKVQLKQDILHVDIYGFQHSQECARIFHNLEQKLLQKNVDPRCPWLNNHPLSFSFK